jgi:Flp pilus assembly protein TadG
MTRNPMTRDEEGSITLYVVIATLVLLVAIGLVIDGGQAMATKAEAVNDAYGAARAGAEALSRSSFAATGTVVEDPAAARAAALAYLARSGHPGRAQVQVQGAQVSVALTVDSSTTLLGLAGVHDIALAAHGQAQATYGIRGPGS